MLRKLLPRPQLYALLRASRRFATDGKALKDMTGLEQMRALAVVFETKLGIGQTLKFRATEIEEGRVVFEGTPGQFAYNPINTIHGGYAATLLDSACACATHTKIPVGQAYTTLSLNVSYLGAMTSKTGPVRAEGRCIRIGRRSAFAEATLKDAQGKLLASATSTLLVMDVP